MRYTVLTALTVLAITFANSTMACIRSASRCRTLSEAETAAIFGGRDETIYECKKKANCWNLLPYLCAEISLDPSKNGLDEGAVAQQCSQTVQVELYKNGPNEECQESEKEKNSCFLKYGDPVACRRVTSCAWDAQLKLCHTGSTYIENTAPPDCQNQ